ncbi:hypothetical protein CBFG_01228 [Clostridiales bacterium 1_7_47FAA]|nr:hypothetical protein CBFG_01228 [Clostridiales bacterium 1_7_47FAA]
MQYLKDTFRICVVFFRGLEILVQLGHGLLLGWIEVCREQHLETVLPQFSSGHFLFLYLKSSWACPCAGRRLVWFYKCFPSCIRPSVHFPFFNVGWSSPDKGSSAVDIIAKSLHKNNKKCIKHSPGNAPGSVLIHMTECSWRDGALVLLRENPATYPLPY